MTTMMEVLRLLDENRNILQVGPSEGNRIFQLVTGILQDSRGFGGAADQWGLAGDIDPPTSGRIESTSTHSTGCTLIIRAVITRRLTSGLRVISLLFGD